MKNIFFIFTILCGTAYADTFSVESAKKLMYEGKRELATEIIITLANNGDLNAKYHLAAQYYIGLVVKKDINKASDIWKIACSAGHQESCANYAVTLSDLGMHQEAEKAYLYAIKKFNDFVSMSNLSTLYNNNEWPGYSPQKAQLWKQRANDIENQSKNE